MLAVRIDHFHRGALFFDGAQLDVGIDRDVGGMVLLAAQISGGLFDEGHERRVQRKIVGEIVKGGSEDQHASFADLLFQQQRVLVGEPGYYARLPWVHADVLEELHALQLVGTPQGRMFGIGGGDGLEAIAFPRSVAGSTEWLHPIPARLQSGR